MDSVIASVLMPIMVILFFMTNASNQIESDLVTSTIQLNGPESDKNHNELNSAELNRMKPLHRHKRAAVVMDKNRLWDSGIIPYEFRSVFELDHIDRIKKAMKAWEKVSCVRFVERDADKHPSYIVFKKRSCGCCAEIGKGRIPGPRYVGLSNYCDSPSIIMHELGHVLGYYHEHIRPDRDDNIEVITDNIAWGLADLFRVQSSYIIDTLGTPYDPHSIMHYRPNEWASSENKLVLISKKKSDPSVGRGAGLSAEDIESVNMLYNC